MCAQLCQKQYKFSMATVINHTLNIIKRYRLLSMSADNRNHLDLVLNCLTVSNAFNEVEYLMICLFQALTVEVEQINNSFSDGRGDQLHQVLTVLQELVAGEIRSPLGTQQRQRPARRN